MGFIFITEGIIGRVFLLFEECDLFNFTTFAMALLSHLSANNFGSIFITERIVRRVFSSKNAICSTFRPLPWPCCPICLRPTLASSLSLNGPSAEFSSFSKNTICSTFRPLPRPCCPICLRPTSMAIFFWSRVSGCHVLEKNIDHHALPSQSFRLPVTDF